MRRLFSLSSTGSSLYPILLEQHSAMSIQGPVCGWRHLRRGSEFMRHCDLRLPPQMSSRETSQGLEDIILFSLITITFCMQEWSVLNRASRFPGYLFPLLWNGHPSIFLLPQTALTVKATDKHHWSLSVIQRKKWDGGRKCRELSLFAEHRENMINGYRDAWLSEKLLVITETPLHTVPQGAPGWNGISSAVTADSSSVRASAELCSANAARGSMPKKEDSLI